MMFNKIKYFAILSLTIFTVACNDDDSNNSIEEEAIVFNCCDNTTLDNMNVDNLDQSAGEIQVSEVITVNGDGMNDVFFPVNLNLYPNNEVTIYDSNNEVIFNVTNYGITNIFPENSNNTTFAEGTYRYKIVVDNEQIYMNNGFFCLIKPTEIEQANDYVGLFTSCFAYDANDPFL